MENQPSYAGFWKRFVAFFLDQLLLGIVCTLIFVPVWFFIFVGYFMNNYEHNGYRFTSFVLQDHSFHYYSSIQFPLLIFVFIIFGLINLIGSWLYYAIMESSNAQGTVGKIIIGIKVTGLHGEKISFTKATGRYFGKIISAIILFIGYIMAGFTEKKQALHDILSSCIVVNRINI